MHHVGFGLRGLALRLCALLTVIALALGALCASVLTEDARAVPTVASWYGPGLFGAPTASGDICCSGYTAAHKTLPFGTEVVLGNLADGREVEVTINDRGPHVAGREFDLSPDAAAAIGLDEAGVMKVEVLAIR